MGALLRRCCAYRGWGGLRREFVCRLGGSRGGGCWFCFCCCGGGCRGGFGSGLRVVVGCWRCCWQRRGFGGGGAGWLGGGCR